MDIAYIKSIAKKLFIEEIKEMPKEIRFRFASGEDEYKKLFKILMENYKENIILKFGTEPYFSFKTQDMKKEDKLEFLKEILEKLES